MNEHDVFDQILHAARQPTPWEQDAPIAHLRAMNDGSSSERGALLLRSALPSLSAARLPGASTAWKVSRGSSRDPAATPMSRPDCSYHWQQ